MITSTARVAAAAVALALLLGACAERPGDGGAAPEPTAALPGDPGTLILRVSLVGGFVPAELTAGRLPLVSVYRDGRVFTEGPVAAIYPGFAWPNVQLQRISPGQVQALIERALAAGVGETTDLGRPAITDVPTTRFTLVTGDRTYVREAYGLREAAAMPDGDRTPPGAGGGLTAEQASARAKLVDLLDALTDLGGASPAQPYAPQAIAAVARPWIEPEGGLAHPERTWPGPALPGEPLAGYSGLGCVTTSGKQTTAVLEAARQATTATPWVTPDGSRWTITFRPLLPDETGCADLT